MAFNFVLGAVGLRSLDDVPTGTVQEAGCDDCIIGLVKDRVCFNFTRDATSLDEAIGSAIASLRNAGVSAYLESVGFSGTTAEQIHAALSKYSADEPPTDSSATHF
ncbi:MAG TPA: hypothetical protein VGN57_07540 [Pirellulaceae bacterium]|jgi:hypothetical protein|nr:hypothetical protein [Pirellulaceae bacterium]